MVFDKIKGIVASQLSKEESDITLETNFQEDLGADSLDLFQIVSDIEDEFEIKIDEVENVKTMGDAVALVERLTK